MTDKGIGIAADETEAVFAPFKQLHGREYPGSGLGLALCKKIVERYHSRIWIESAKGGGSVVSFTLPAV